MLRYFSPPLILGQNRMAAVFQCAIASSVASIKLLK